MEQAAGAPGKTEIVRGEKIGPDWLQHIIDTLGSEYGWTKPEIFELYPGEINILMRRISIRRSEEERRNLLNLSRAALVPYMKKDGRTKWFEELEKPVAAGYNDGADVTQESIAAQTRAVVARRKANPPPRK